MRGVSIAVGVSVLVHAGAIAWVGASDFTDDEPLSIVAPAQPEQPVAQNPQEDPVLEVTFFTYAGNAGGDGIVSAKAAAPSKRGDDAKRGRGDFSTGSSHGVELGTGTEPSRSPYMKMRGPEKPQLEGLSSDFWAKFAENTKPLPPPPDIPGERIGNEIAEVRAQLKRAGRYSPDELRALREQIVALNEERANEELKPAGGGTFKTEKETFRAKVNADGSVKLEDIPENMDSQDKLMKRHGIDPYGRNKLAYLDRTRDQRVAIGKRFREEQLKKSVVFMQKNITWLFAVTSDEQKRKQGLFELWDECIETGTPEEVAGGAEARAHVMAWIRAKVKYTDEELKTLNAKRISKEEFAP